MQPSTPLRLRIRRAASAATCAIACALAVAAAPASAAGPGPVTSRFDLGVESWRVLDLFSVPAGATSAPGYEASPGLISATDIYSWTVFSAPSAFLGDKSAFAGGTLAFDLSDTLRDALSPNFPTLVLRSGTDFLAWKGGVPGTSLTSFSATLAPSTQWLAGTSPATATPATAADFAHVLGALDGLYVNADWATAAVDVSRLDNVVLAAAVPEPASAALCAAGLAAVLAAGARSRRRGPAT